MSKKRRRFSAKFKTVLPWKLCLENFPFRTGQQVWHPRQSASQRKKQAKEYVADGFTDKTKKTRKSDEALVKDLHAKIGQLTVEKDFFATNLRQNQSCERRCEIVDKERSVLNV